jgi:uncharacterized membrane protein HdeD (DUF308 family)
MPKLISTPVLTYFSAVPSLSIVFGLHLHYNHSLLKIRTMDEKIKHYRATLLVNGLIAIIFGGLVLVLPKETLKTITIYFGILLGLGGVFGIVNAIQHFKNQQPFLSSLIISIVSIGVGGVMIFNTQRSLEIFGIVVGIWAVIIGIVQLFIALNLLESGRYKTVLLSNSVITILFGALLFTNPFGSMVVLVWLAGVLAIAFGAILLFFGFSIKKAE